MKWLIRGLSLKLDFEDFETGKRIDHAFQTMEEEEKQILNREYPGISEKIRDYCNMYRNLFTNLFGAETAGQIFQNIPENSRDYDDIYLSFLRYSQAARLEAADKRAKKFRFPTVKQKHAKKRKKKC